MIYKIESKVFFMPRNRCGVIMDFFVFDKSKSSDRVIGQVMLYRGKWYIILFLSNRGLCLCPLTMG